MTSSVAIIFCAKGVVEQMVPFENGRTTVIMHPCWQSEVHLKSSLMGEKGWISEHVWVALRGNSTC